VLTQLYLPPTFIQKRNESYLPLLPSCRASPHFGWYSFPVPLRVGGWVGLGGLMKYWGGLPVRRRSPILVLVAAAGNRQRFNIYTVSHKNGANLVVSVTSSNINNASTCDGMNFTLLTWLVLLHYLVRVETPKMHVNTNSAFNVNCKIAIKCTKLHWQFSQNVLMKHIIQINNNFAACVQSVRQQHACMISDCRATGQSQPNVLFKVIPSLHQAFLQVIDVTNLCFVHVLLHNAPKIFIIYSSISTKHIRYVWCNFLW